MLALLITFPACTSIRPVSKIGLIAPFEGLYRETGYAALDATRQAIADCAPAAFDVIPLALDESNQPSTAAQSAQKLLADAAVTTVIGPFSLDTVNAVAPDITRSDLTWIVPTAVDADGRFTSSPERSDWQAELILQAAYVAASEGAGALYVGGLPPAWLDATQEIVADASTAIPIRFLSDDPDFAQLQPQDALLWLGLPHLAAEVLARLHAAQPEATFWLGPQADSPVFSEHNKTSVSVYWLTWVTPLYNPAVQPAPGSLTAQLTYAATCQALAGVTGRDDASGGADSPSLRLSLFRIEGKEIRELSSGL